MSRHSTRPPFFARVLFPALTLMLVLFASCGEQNEPFVIDRLNRFNPVVSQGSQSACWVYAMLSTIETEHIMRGDSVILSAPFVLSWLRSEPAAPPSGRGTAMTLLWIIRKHGVVPLHSMPDTTCTRPRWAFMLGAEYTPLEFAHSVCAPDEYVALATDSRRPLGQTFVFDSPDNWTRALVTNVSPDSLLAFTVRAVSGGHGVCWEGDISEPGFDWKEGIARTTMFDGSTTDDHCMAVVGLAHDREGGLFLVMKNSWGTHNKQRGLLFMSYDYFRSKTLCVVGPRP